MSTPNWEEFVIKIKASGWHQGSILPSQLAQQVTKDHAPDSEERLKDLEEGGVLALASHTCDIQNMAVAKDGTPAEPFVEAILGKPIPGAPGEQKTIRFIDLALQKGTEERTYRFWDQTRFRFPREFLAGHAPLSESISEEDCRRLARFLAKRYDRPAFPDAFEEALRPACVSKDKKANTLPRLLKAQPDLFTGIFFELTPGSEIGGTEKYSLTITGTMRSRQFSSQEEIVSGRYKYFDDTNHLEAADNLLKIIAETITTNCPRIDLVDPKTEELRCQVESEGVLSVARYRLMVRYDWDYLSPDSDDLPAESPE